MAKNLMRLSQLVTSFGPGAMIDLPRWSVMIAGLDRWDDGKRRRIVEPRLERRLPDGLQRGLATPPVHRESPYRNDAPGVQTIVFPGWFVTTRGRVEGEVVRRRLVRFSELDQKTWKLVEAGKDEKPKAEPVAPVRFVAACERGHVQDIDWRLFVHRGPSDCGGRLFLVETGATGDVRETLVECECGVRRPVYDALGKGNRALGPCRGKRPWLGPDADESCDLDLRLLVRTASNAYFPVTVTVLSLPPTTEEQRIDEMIVRFRDDLATVTSVEELQTAFRYNSALREALRDIPPDKVVAALERVRERPTHLLKPEEFDILAGDPQGRREDPQSVLVTEHLDRAAWNPHNRLPILERLTLVHRLRVVTALRGFTRFDFVTPDADGELDPKLKVQELSCSSKAYPAIEQWGEGLFLLFDRNRVKSWAARPDVIDRTGCLERGFRKWAEDSGRGVARFPGTEWIALHTIAHLLLAEIALEGGYPLATLRERIYASEHGYGILLYAASLDVGGTLGGLVALGPRLVELVERARERGGICSADPVCAEHDPTGHTSGHPLAGAACHGCVLLPEPCCEMRNDFLDRALAVGTIRHPGLGLLRAGDGA